MVSLADGHCERGSSKAENPDVNPLPRGGSYWKRFYWSLRDVNLSRFLLFSVSFLFNLTLKEHVMHTTSQTEIKDVTPYLPT